MATTLRGSAHAATGLGNGDAEDEVPPEDPRASQAPRLAQADAELVFGIIKSVMGFRQFRLRGLENAGGERSLETMSWNLKRLFALHGA